MADAAHDIPRMSATEYLQMERQATCKHEFANGIVYAMAGTSRRHNDIALNIAAALNDRMPVPCRANALDLKVRIKAGNEEQYYYPDGITCSELDNDDYIIMQPTLIVEVLSSSTEAVERGSKFNNYRLLPSLQQYVIVLQNKASVEFYRRRTTWEKETYVISDEINFESVHVTIPVASFYRRVTF